MTVRIKLAFFLLLTCCTAASAQSFKWQASLEKVSTAGFYRISLTPQFISKTENTDLSDIRIFEKNKEIAYLLRQESDLYIPVPAPSITSLEDTAQQRTIVQMDFDADYQLNKIILKPAGARYYRRSAWLTRSNPLVGRKKRINQENKLLEFIISSETPPVVRLPGSNRYRKLFVVIENEDNAAISVKNVQAYQQNMELIAYLDKGKRYTIKTGRTDLQPPRYDLDYFRDSIRPDVPLVGLLDFKKISETKTPLQDNIPEKRRWMWVAIGILILFLGYLSYSIVKDMQRKK